MTAVPDVVDVGVTVGSVELPTDVVTEDAVVAT